MSFSRILVAIPAFNEAPSIEQVVQGVRGALPAATLLVVDDGSDDDTPAILRRLSVPTARHLANLGYGRAIQTAIRCAMAGGYEALITLDADGQHDPSQLPAVLDALAASGWDLCVGSRYVGSQSYRGAPFGRRIAMRAFSVLVGLLASQRIYDTTSGLKAFRSTVYSALALWHFVDFHAEAIVYLQRLGYRIGEHPITVAERQHGNSMYSLLSASKYPAKTLLMILLGLLQAELTQRRGK
jgi:glycosyltransferase involved in cell wall biosynthesis